MYDALIAYLAGRGIVLLDDAAPITSVVGGIWENPDNLTSGLRWQPDGSLKLFIGGDEVQHWE